MIVIVLVSLISLSVAHNCSWQLPRAAELLMLLIIKYLFPDLYLKSAPKN